MPGIEVIWNQVVGGGAEHLTLKQDSLIEADGLAVGMLKDEAYRIQYQIVCDKGWNVLEVSVQDRLHENSFILTHREEEWLDDKNHPIEALRECTEVDIMVTPFTNTLPIRRLNLSKGQAKN